MTSHVVFVCDQSYIGHVTRDKRFDGILFGRTCKSQIDVIFYKYFYKTTPNKVDSCATWVFGDLLLLNIIMLNRYSVQIVIIELFQIHVMYNL